MKFLKYLGIILLVLAGVWLALCIVGPTSLQFERSTTIEAPASVVYKNVSCLDKWSAWSAWSAMDPEMVNTYSENPCGQDAWVNWVGEKAGEGKQIIVEANLNAYLKTELAFAPGYEINYSEWNFSEEEGVTTVSWSFVGAETPFYMKGMNVMMKSFLGNSYEKGLKALKEVAESAPVVEESTYTISEVDLPEAKILLISGELNPSGISEFYELNFSKLETFIGENGIEMTGHPTGLFFTWTDTLTSMAAAMPIATEVDGTDEIEFRTVEASRALQIDYYGAYDQSGAAHYAMDDYMEANDLKVNGHVIEVYMTDPSSEPDTSKWLTKVIYPVLAK